MSRNKYVNDYRLEPSVNEKGKIKTTTRYIGQTYFYVASGEKVRRSKRVLLAAAAVGWIAFFAALVPAAPSMRELYFSLPFAFCALPLWMVSEIAVTAVRSVPPFEHRTADRLSAGLAFRSVLFLVFSVSAVIGYAVYVIINFRSASPTDAVPGVSSVVLCFCAAATFAVRKDFSTVSGGEEKDGGAE